MILPAKQVFSKRSGWDRSTNRLSELVAAKYRSGEKVLDLTESNPTRCGFTAVSPAPLADPQNRFYEPDPHGLLSARKAVAAYYAEKGIAVRPEQVFLTSGTSEAYHFLCRLLTDPGQKIACAAPGYPLLDTLAELNDVVLSRYTLSEGIDPEARAVLVVHPNNPTGKYIASAERKELNAFCSKNGQALIVDEVFLDFSWEDGWRPESFAGNAETLTFTLSGVSKVLALPQMKLSWIVVSGPDAQRREAIERLEVIADAYLSVNTPSQQALPAWLSGRQKIREEILSRVRANLSFLQECVRSSGFGKVLPSQGGWYATLALPPGRTDEATALEWLDKKNVLVHPGYFFDFAEEDRMVFSLLPEGAVFQEGVRKAFNI